MPKKKKGRPKKLPRGLQEFEGSIVLADMETVAILVKRLLDLPEFGLHNHMKVIASLIAKAEQAEEEAVRSRRQARDAVEQLWDKCLANWTIEELQEATGYDED